MTPIAERIAEAASDYKMAVENDGFAAEYGGVEALRQILFALVVEWEGVTDQLYQVWDFAKGQAQSYHSTRAAAEEKAKALNAQSAFDANGLPRYVAGEAND